MCEQIKDNNFEFTCIANCNCFFRQRNRQQCADLCSAALKCGRIEHGGDACFLVGGEFTGEAGEILEFDLVGGDQFRPTEFKGPMSSFDPEPNGFCCVKDLADAATSSSTFTTSSDAPLAPPPPPPPAPPPAVTTTAPPTILKATTPANTTDSSGFEAWHAILVAGGVTVLATAGVACVKRPQIKACVLPPTPRVEEVSLL